MMLPALQHPSTVAAEPTYPQGIHNLGSSKAKSFCLGHHMHRSTVWFTVHPSNSSYDSSTGMYPMAWDSVPHTHHGWLSPYSSLQQHQRRILEGPTINLPLLLLIAKPWHCLSYATARLTGPQDSSSSPSWVSRDQMTDTAQAFLALPFHPRDREDPKLEIFILVAIFPVSQNTSCSSPRHWALVCTFHFIL